jgi:hypothetical protein
VNGQEPVKEALIYRRISKPDGTIINQDWVRCGFQDGSWYAQRLTPDTNNPSKLISTERNYVCGASFTHLWVISDQNVHVADKACSHGSVPDRFGRMSRDFAERSLTLGMPPPADGIGSIHWNRLNFKTWTRTESNAKGHIKTNMIGGRLHLGSNGLPATAECEGIGNFAAVTILYEYGQLARNIPKVFTITIDKPETIILRYEFLSLIFGKVELEKTGGYVPQMFGDPHRHRVATIWTNDLPYTVVGSELRAAFETSKPKQTGSIILGALAITMITFLALWLKRWK